VGCAGELVRSGENGLVVPVGDQAALAQALKRLLADEPLRQKFSDAGRQAVKNLPAKQEYLSQYQKSWQVIL